MPTPVPGNAEVIQHLTHLIDLVGIRYARDESIDLIVLGTHGHSGLMHGLLGSVAEMSSAKRRALC